MDIPCYVIVDATNRQNKMVAFLDKEKAVEAANGISSECPFQIDVVEMTITDKHMSVVHSAAGGLPVLQS